jgi:hypothetical protein
MGVHPTYGRASIPHMSVQLVCVHPHALLWYAKHPIHIGPSARRTPRQSLLGL